MSDPNPPTNTPSNKDEVTELRICLRHVIHFIDGDGGFDLFKPLSAQKANQIAEMCNLVLQGKTTEQAIKEVQTL